MNSLFSKYLICFKYLLGVDSKSSPNDVMTNQSIKSGDGSTNIQVGQDANFYMINQCYPVEIIDQRISEDLDRLRKLRFFREFDTIEAAKLLAQSLTTGDLVAGSRSARSEALAWCVRILVRDGHLELAEKFLQLASSLGSCEAIDIAGALIASQKGNKAEGLGGLVKHASPCARSASLNIIVHHDGESAAIDWMVEIGIGALDLDSYGRSLLLNLHLTLENWDSATEVVAILEDQDYEDIPVLHHLAAISILSKAIPLELRKNILMHVPFNASIFPLRSDPISMVARKSAHERFSHATTVASSLNMVSAANEDQEYALWLELTDPSLAESGKHRLETLLGNSRLRLRLIPLALQFGIQLNFDLVEREIDSLAAAHGGITRDGAFARFALIDRQNSPEGAARYIEKHIDSLTRHLSPKTLRSILAEAYAKSGDVSRANEILNDLLSEGLTVEEEAQLRTIISESNGQDPIASLKQQYETSNSVWDLDALVRGLEEKQDWKKVCTFGEQLFKRTSSVQCAVRYVHALQRTYDSDTVVEFLKSNTHLLSQSKMLQLSYGLSLYHEGELLAAKEELGKCDSDYDELKYRALKVNLAIALGDWGSLLVYIDNEYAKRTNRVARELLMTAQLAVHVNSPYAKDLIVAAVEKASDDATLLASAYILATNAGWEDDETVAGWLHRAASLSGDDGPIQTATLQDFLDRRPDWERRESDTIQSFGRGDIPIFLAAQLLNRNLIDLFLLPAFANPSVHDPRKRSAISAYSGQRISSKLDLKAGPIGLDPTALLTLSYLGLLEESLTQIDEVYVPHSTLAWLFKEKQKATFHQPSRIKDARKIRDLLATGSLDRLVPSVVIDSDLAQQVGDDLALLITEAEKNRDDDVQQIVVRSSPIHRISSLMKSEADVSAHAPVLCSCLGIVNKLREVGHITADEERKAVDYLQLHEKQWPSQLNINDGAILYLDGLSVTYLLHVGLLDKLHAAGFHVIISSGVIEEVGTLLDYEGLSTKVVNTIEQIRSIVSSGIASSKIRLGRQCIKNESEAQSLTQQLTLGVIELANYCDTVILDDRFFNRHTQVVEGDSKCSILTTLDLLDSLASAGVIPLTSLAEHRTKLRRAGYFFMPVNAEELRLYLTDSPVKDGQVCEIAELKAIRESILRVRMNDWLQLPQEAAWIDANLKTYITVLKDLWRSDVDLVEVKARSNWLIVQVDIRGWAHALPRQYGTNFSEIQTGPYILLLMSPPLDVPKTTILAYLEWIEETVLVPLKEQSPDLYQWIIEYQKRLVLEIPEIDIATEEHV